MILSIFTDFCNCWWLAWLLPFLLGLLLGWLLFCWLCSRGPKARVAELEDENRGLRKRIKDLEDQLAACKAKRSSLDSEISMLKGKMRENQAPKVTPVSSIAATPKPAPVKTAAVPAAKFGALKSDNLQVVEGIGPKMNSVLNDAGVTTWGDLAAKTGPQVKTDILGKYGDKYRIIDPTTWPAQARLAHEGRWDDLIAMQKQLDTGKVGTRATSTDSKVEKIMIKMGLLKRWKQDDLKAVEGIGPKIEQLLHADGIKTWKALSEAAVSRVQGILDNAGSRFKLADPETWGQQAGMAHRGEWDELEKFQDLLQGGKTR